MIVVWSSRSTVQKVKNMSQVKTRLRRKTNLATHHLYKLTQTLTIKKVDATWGLRKLKRTIWEMLSSYYLMDSAMNNQFHNFTTMPRQDSVPELVHEARSRPCTSLVNGGTMPKRAGQQA
jgi:hypothetical protein